MSSPTILIVEDEPAIVELLTFALGGNGWNIKAANSAEQAWTRIQNEVPALMLLDWMLPDLPGIRLLSRVRGDRQFKELPVIMLTAKGSEEDKVAGLNQGADDYITKPFSPRELAARIKALLRRKRPHLSDDILQVGAITLDPNSNRVTIDQKHIVLANAEFKLLRFFMSYPERALSRTHILDSVWGGDVELEERTVDVHILRLRKALGESGEMLKTVRQVGYMLSVR